ncbi:MAG: peptide deformylase [Patescibacteria group bacterium]|jgi:peptide deformylase
MPPLPVLKNPNKELRVVSAPVDVSRLKTKPFNKLIADLKATMKEENGVGIAAPQTGVHDRVIIAETKDGPTAFINPEITERAFKLVDSEEGCLSVPGIWGIVKRHRSVTVKALQEDGNELTVRATGLLAIIFQHEIDHLDGILFIDRATELRKTGSSRI